MSRRTFTLVLLVIVMSLSSGPALGQDSEDLARLKKFLSMPDSTTLRVSEGGLPRGGETLKIYIATDEEPTAGDLLRKYVAEYNEKGKGAQRLEIVSSAAMADIVLVQFEAREKRRVENDTTLAMDPTMATAAGGRRDPTYRSEIRGYMLVRDGDAFTVVQSYRKSVKLGGKRYELRNTFSKALEKGRG